MYVQRHPVTIETAVGGAGEGYTPVVNGRILAISYVKDDYAAGVDFTITTETTLQDLWVEQNVNASEVIYPLAAAGLNIPAGDERVKIVIGSGGDGKSGTFHVLVG